MEKVLIIEDEKLAAKKLKMLLQQLDAGFEVLDIIPSVEKAVHWLSNYTADLIFLDINLSDDVSFKIFERVEIETPIIFITAYDEYAIRAFKQNSLDYLLKPVTQDELAVSLKKYEKYKNRSAEVNERMKLILKEYFPQQTAKSRVLISYGSKHKSIELSKVAYLYAYEKGVFLTTFDNKTYLINETLDVMESQLDKKVFFRVNRKFLVNINAIEDTEKYSSRKIKVNLFPEPKFSAIVPVEKITPFKAWMNS